MIYYFKNIRAVTATTTNFVGIFETVLYIFLKPELYDFYWVQGPNTFRKYYSNINILFRLKLHSNHHQCSLIPAYTSMINKQHNYDITRRELLDFGKKSQQPI